MKFLITKKSGFVLTLLLFFAVSCKNSDKKASTEENPKTTDAHALIKNAEIEIDEKIIEAMHEAISKDEYPNIHSLLISKNNTLIYEEYFKGQDEIWGDAIGEIEHSKDLLHDVRSISKTIVSLCVGVALKLDQIDSVDQKVSDFFPEHKKHFAGDKAGLTVKHLLTMTSGLEWNEDVPYNDPRNSEIQMTSSSDPIEFILSRPLTSKPGEAWRYNGGTTQLLAVIIQKVSGLSIDKYAEKHLFQPLHIESHEWTKFPQINLPAAASGLRLTSRDLFKFGVLISQNGKWKGHQLIPLEYMRDAMKSHITFGRNNNVGYGYQFWILKASTIFKGENHSIVAAFGNGDQRIYFDDTHDLLVVFTAGNYNKWDIKKDSESVLSDFIYPALINQ